MGLGPPICTKCKRVLDLITPIEKQELIDKGIMKENSYLWWCSKCDAQSYYTKEGTITNDCISHLFSLSIEEQEIYLKGN